MEEKNSLLLLLMLWKAQAAEERRGRRTESPGSEDRPGRSHGRERTRCRVLRRPTLTT